METLEVRRITFVEREEKKKRSIREETLVATGSSQGRNLRRNRGKGENLFISWV